MRRKSAETRERIIDAAYGVFYKHGFNNAGVDVIAERSGFTKRTLYQHFGSKDALIEAVLQKQHDLAMARTRAWADAVCGDAEAMVETIFAKLFHWAGKEDWQGSGFTRAAVEFCDLPGHPARKSCIRHKEAVETLLRDKFFAAGVAEADELARSIMILIEGSMALVLIHGDRSYIQTASRAAVSLAQCHGQ